MFIKSLIDILMHIFNIYNQYIYIYQYKLHLLEDNRLIITKSNKVICLSFRNKVIWIYR